MYTSKGSHEPLVYEVYEQNQSTIRRIRENLPEEVVAGLAREVILRLAERDSTLEHLSHQPSQRTLRDFCTALISDDDSAAAEIILDVRADGIPVEDIYLKYIAAAARMLGDWWTDDRADFLQITLGTGRLFSIMRGMQHLFEPAPNSEDKFAVFASVPGENHTLGVRMAADLFRKDGWDIALKVGLEHDELVAELERTPTRVIGLSVGGRHSIDPLSRLVFALRICCPHAALFASGQNIEEVRPLVSLMGLDGIAGDIDQAKEQMSTLWMGKAAS